MPLFVDVKYANIIAHRHRNFKKKGDYLWNFSCGICGDSRTNKTKARGFIYKVKSALFYKCHKCGVSTNLGNLLRHVDSNLYQEYALENYKESGAPRAQHSKPVENLEFFKTPAINTSVDLVDAALDSLKRLDKLSDIHPAVKYAIKRQIPRDKWHLLYFCTQFKRYVNSLVPNKFKRLDDEHPRLIIPYFNSHGKCFAFQGRAFGPEDPKYITIKLDETEEKVYGLDRVNFANRIYVTEGPLDSLFIPNAIAVSGSSFNTPTIEALKTNATIVYDNEPRSPTLVKLIKSTIDRGFSVCLWPDTVEGKDINDMILSGMDPGSIIKVIDQNTVAGAEASLKFAMWKKCQ
jgi:hypothetical protein